MENVQCRPGQPGHAAAVARRRAQRLIALFEASKGIVALAASIGLLSLLHHDLREMAETAIGRFGLDAGSHYPKALLHYAEVLQDTSVRTLQRVLRRDSGSDFRELVNVIRMRRAKELLAGTRASITEIAMEFGYSSPANFARAFRNAAGLAPHEYRLSLGSSRGRPPESLPRGGPDA